MSKSNSAFSANRREICRAIVGSVALATLPLPTLAARRKIVIASGIDAYFAAFPVATEQGLMGSKGIDLSVRSFEFGGIALDALLTGDAHVGSSSAVTGMTRWDRGGRLYTAAALSSSGTSYGASVSKRIQKPEDLYGKAVAVSKLTSGEFFYEEFLKTFNLDGSKIEVKNLGPSEAIAALHGGDVDGFFMWEPWNSRAKEAIKGAHTLVTSGDVGVDFVMYLYFSEPLVKDKTLSQDVVGSLIEASEWISQNQNETANILNKYYRLPKKDAMNQLQGLTFNMNMHKLPVIKDFERLAEFSLRHKLIKNVPAWNEMMRPEIMRAVAPERVSGW